MADNTPGSRMLFVNLPVANVEKSKAFFVGLGFTFDPKFTDENAACMIIGKDCFAMLLHEPYFRTFTKKKISDTSTQTETLLAVSCASRGEVEDLMAKALAAGGTKATDGMDQEGFMIVRTFYDLDGHHWELMWMDPKAMAA